MRRTVMALPHLRKPTKSSAAKAPTKAKRGRPAKKSKKAHAAEEDEPAQYDEEVLSSFPVVVTTYDIIIRDRVHLSKYDWGYIVVDEGHRLKNLNCKLMKEIKQYRSAGRMILTGTPLHVRFPLLDMSTFILNFFQNNLAELWSLLNFILPDIFTDIDSFQDLYAFSLSGFVSRADSAPGSTSLSFSTLCLRLNHHISSRRCTAS